MLKIFSLFFIVAGIYVGVQYKDTIVDVLGQDSLDQVEDAIGEGKELLVDKIDELNG